MRPSDLRGYTLEELVELAAEVRRKNLISNEERERTGSIHLYPPEARLKLDAIAWAITGKLREERAG